MEREVVDIEIKVRRKDGSSDTLTGQAYAYHIEEVEPEHEDIRSGLGDMIIGSYTVTPRLIRFVWQPKQNEEGVYYSVHYVD